MELAFRLDRDSALDLRRSPCVYLA